MADLEAAARLFAHGLTLSVDIVVRLLSRKLRAKTGGGKRPSGTSRSTSSSGSGGKPTILGPSVPLGKNRPRRQRKNSTKTRTERAKTNIDNLDGRRGGHSKAKHGTQVTPQQHEDRLRTGRDPQTGKIPVDEKGNPKLLPKSSSSFDSNEKHLEALGKADTKLSKERFNSKGGYKKQVEIDIDVKNAGTSYRLEKSGNLVSQPVHRAKAVYRLIDPAKGTYKLVTLYPTN